MEVALARSSFSIRKKSGAFLGFASKMAPETKFGGLF
jgi:hypothetical protein